MVRYALLALAVLGQTARADDDAIRRAKAALALAASAREVAAVPPAVAPAPRVSRPLSYGDGYAAAVKEGRPLVVYVGHCGPKVEGAVTACAAELPGVAGPMVVVSYPQGGGLRYDAELPATSSPGEVKRAADAAARKIDAGGGRAAPRAPKPLDWDA